MIDMLKTYCEEQRRAALQDAEFAESVVYANADWDAALGICRTRAEVFAEVLLFIKQREEEATP